MTFYIIQLSWSFLTLDFTVWDFSLQLILGITTACHLVKETSAMSLTPPHRANMAKRSHFRKVSLLSLGWQRSVVN